MSDKENEMFATVISLENEIEFLKEEGYNTVKQKRELNQLMKQIKNISQIKKNKEAVESFKVKAEVYIPKATELHES